MRTFLFLMLLGSPFLSMGQWTQVRSAPGTVNYLVHFENADTGIVMGESSGRNQLLRTTDGGSTWSLEMLDTAGTQVFPFIRKHFITDRMGFVADRGAIWFTRDAGRQFEFRGTPLAYVSGLHFLDSLQGFASVSDQGISHTTDGGRNWSVSPVLAPPTKTWRDVWAWDANNQKLCGSFGTPALNGGSLVASTTDGGGLWQPFVVDSNFYAGSDLEFVDDSIGFYADEARLWKTTNRGASWIPVLQAPGFNKVVASYFLDSLTGFAWGPPNGYLIKTTDGGATWEPQAAANVWQINNLHCPTPQVCYAVGVEGLVMKTTSGGGTLAQETPSLQPAFKLFPNPAMDRILLSAALGNGIFTIVDLQGKVMEELIGLAGESVELNIAAWPPGVYTCTFATEGKLFTCRWVKP